MYGKVSFYSLSKDLRAIITMSSLPRIFDRILALYLEPPIDALLPVKPGIFVGGRRHMQTLDIGHSMSLLVEKGLDLGPNVGIAQADVKQYFDSLPLLRVVRWLLARGIDRALLSSNFGPVSCIPILS